MGTGVGIPALAVIGIGALIGGATGGVAGNGLGALLAGEVLDPITLVLVFCTSLGAAIIIVYAVRTLHAAISATYAAVSHAGGRLFGRKIS